MNMFCSRPRYQDQQRIQCRPTKNGRWRDGEMEREREREREKDMKERSINKHVAFHMYPQKHLICIILLIYKKHMWSKISKSHYPN